MSGGERNPQISQMTQMNAGGDTSVVATQSSAQEGESLIVDLGRLVQRVARLEMLVQGILNGGGGEPEPPTADASIERIIVEAWGDAPLPLRLKFARELLQTDHPLQAILKEAISLEELRRNGRELETWLTGYPSLFADAVERLETRPTCGATTAESLAMQTLHEARQAFAAEVEALGIEWILPAAGASIGEEHEVVGEEEASVPAGRVAVRRRRGFRQRGKLLLAAQVTRALPPRRVESVPVALPPAENDGVTPGSKGAANEGQMQHGAREREAYHNEPVDRAHTPVDSPAGETTVTAVSGHTSTVESEASAERALSRAENNVINPWPDWLRAFQQRAMGCDLPAVRQLLAELRALAQEVSQYASGAGSEADLMARLEPLLTLLGARHVPSLLGLSGEWGEVAAEARDDVLAWLSSVMNILPIGPGAGERCDTATMQVTGTRRTAHAHEDGTVAKVERIGLRRGDRVLFRAQVLRYEMGANYE